MNSDQLAELMKLKDPQKDLKYLNDTLRTLDKLGLHETVNPLLALFRELGGLPSDLSARIIESVRDRRAMQAIEERDF